MRPRLIFGVTVSIVLFGLVPSLCFGAEPLPSIIDPDAYAVYSAILPQVPMVKRGNATCYVIATEIHPLKMCLEPDADYRPLMQSAIDSYVELNATKRRLQALFAVGRPYDLQPAQILNDLPWEMPRVPEPSSSRGEHASSRSTRQLFDERFPGAHGYVWLSAVGFNSDKTIAIVSMGYACGWMCMADGFHVLQLKNGTWVPFDWKGGSCSVIS